MYYNSHCSTRSDGCVPKSGRVSSQPPIQRRNSLARAIALVLMSGMVVMPAWATETTQEQTVAKLPQTEETQTGNSAAYQIYRDPVTGKFGPPPADATGNPPLDLSTIQPSLSTSSEGLKEEYAMKGKMVRLNGSFQDATIVTKDAGGNIVPTPQPSVSDSATQNPSDVVVTPTQKQKE